MNAGILGFTFRRSRLAILAACGFMLLFGVSLAGFYAGVRPDRTLTGVLEMMPPVMRNFLGGQHLDLISPAGFLAMNFKHPLALLCTCAATVTIASRGLAGEVGAGTVDLLLTHPVRRAGLVAAAALPVFAAAVLVPLALWCGHLIGVGLFSVPLDGYAGRFLVVVLHAVLFSCFVGTLALLVSAASAVRSRAVGITVMLLGVLLFADVAAQLYHPLAWLKHLTPFGYFEPAKVVKAGAVFLVDAAVLAFGSAALTITAGVVFSRRQIP